MSTYVSITTIILSLIMQTNEKMVTLASVERTAAETAVILKDIAEHPRRQACLQVFCLCMELVKWVRNVAKSRYLIGK